MIFFFPYDVDVGVRRTPIANWVIIAANLAVFVLQVTGRITPAHIDEVNDGGWNPIAMIESCYLHAGVFHILGNMFFLWTFGNAVNAALGDLKYVLLYHGLGLFSSAAMQVMHGELGIGASGAVSGIVGMYAVLFPMNEVSCYWGFWIGWRGGEGGTVGIAGVWLVAGWLIWDIGGALLPLASNVGHWAHIAGFVGGIATAFILDHFRWTLLEPEDQVSILALATGRHEDLRQKKIDRLRPRSREELLKELREREPARPKAKPVDDDSPIPMD
ncbi:MAG: rhomboid family intramembrane serine protease [Phycisphaerales bacterium]